MMMREEKKTPKNLTIEIFSKKFKYKMRTIFLSNSAKPTIRRRKEENIESNLSVDPNFSVIFLPFSNGFWDCKMIEEEIKGYFRVVSVKKKPFLGK